MKFARFEMLFLIWVLPLILAAYLYGWRRRRRILSDYTSLKGIDSLSPAGLAGRRRLKAGLLSAVLFFIIISLSGPQYGYKWQEIEQKGIDIIIALDCSRSMLATDIGPTRLDRAKREVLDLLSLLEGDRIGLVAFAGTAFLQAPLTLDYSGFHIFLNALSPDYLPVGGTDIAAAISTSLSGFNRESNTEKAIIIITDGEHTGYADLRAAVSQAEKADVKLFAVGVGGKEGVPIPEKEGGFKKDKTGKIILTRLDEDSLKQISARTGGTYVRSIAGDMDLDVLYTRDIRGKMAMSALSSGRKKVWEDRYQWFLMMALAAYLIEFMLPAVNLKKAISVALLAFCLFIGQPSQTAAASYRANMKNGLKAYSEGDYQTALKFFADAQLEDPGKTDILYNIGNTYYKIGDYDAAIYHFKEALKSEDDALRKKALYNLGNASYRKQMLEEALKNYEEALKIDPEDRQTKENIEFVKKLQELQKQQQQQQNQSEDSEEKDDNKKPEKSSQSEGRNKKDQQESSQDKKDQQQDQEKGGQAQQKPSYGKEMSEEEQKKALGSQQGNPQAQPSPPTGVMGQQEPEADKEKKQAERALNRLKDQPGRAAIPLYRDKQVEKDW